MDSNSLKYVEFNERDTKKFELDKLVVVFRFSQKCGVPLILLSAAPLLKNTVSPFYLAIKYKSLDNCWYKQRPMGKNNIGSIMNILAEKANLQGKKTSYIEKQW